MSCQSTNNVQNKRNNYYISTHCYFLASNLKVLEKPLERLKLWKGIVSKKWSTKNNPSDHWLLGWVMLEMKSDPEPDSQGTWKSQQRQLPSDRPVLIGWYLYIYIDRRSRCFSWQDISGHRSYNNLTTALKTFGKRLYLRHLRPQGPRANFGRHFWWVFGSDFSMWVADAWNRMLSPRGVVPATKNYDRLIANLQHKPDSLVTTI